MFSVLAHGLGQPANSARRDHPTLMIIIIVIIRNISDRYTVILTGGVVWSWRCIDWPSVTLTRVKPILCPLITSATVQYKHKARIQVNHRTRSVRSTRKLTVVYTRNKICSMKSVSFRSDGARVRYIFRMCEMQMYTIVGLYTVSDDISIYHAYVVHNIYCDIRYYIYIYIRRYSTYNSFSSSSSSYNVYKYIIT